MSNDTHVVTTPNKRAPVPIEVFRNHLEGEFINTVSAYFRGDKDAALSFKTACVDYVRKVPKLLECDRISLLSALVQVAQFRFMPSGVGGEAYIIPYGKEAKFQLGYQGLVTLLYRTVTVKAISANVVYENDEFDYEEGLNPRLIHKPTKFGQKKGKAIGVYTVAQLEGQARTFKVMGEDEVMAIKNMSKAKNSKESPWNSNDPELWMWKKTCLIQMAKLLPKTQELQKAIEEDYKGEGMPTPDLHPEGPATGKAFHEPVSPASGDTPPDEVFEEPSVNVN